MGTGKQYDLLLDDSIDFIKAAMLAGEGDLETPQASGWHMAHDSHCYALAPLGAVQGQCQQLSRSMPGNHLVCDACFRIKMGLFYDALRGASVMHSSSVSEDLSAFVMPQLDCSAHICMHTHRNVYSCTFTHMCTCIHMWPLAASQGAGSQGEGPPRKECAREDCR